MLEVWASQVDPGLWMLVEQRANIPANQSETDWSHLGGCRVSEAVKDEVRRNGHVAYRSNHPFDPGAILGEGASATRIVST